MERFMTAKEARELSTQNSPRYKIIREILEKIRQATNEGKYETPYSFTDVNTLYAQDVYHELAKLGYNVRIITARNDIFVTW